jgi:serine/threonine protein kinase
LLLSLFINNFGDNHINALEPGNIIGDNFMVVDQLGAGAFGEVYRVMDYTTGQQFAFKRNLKKGDEAAFEAEHQTMQIIGGGSHIPAYWGKYISATGEQFIVSQFIEGQTLGEYIFDCSEYFGDRSSDWYAGYAISAFKIISQVCDALNYAHSRGVLHLDLTLNNILIQEDGSPIVIDWGIERLVSKRLEKGRILGQPSYISPELARAESCDNRSDLYSLGILSLMMFLGVEEFPISGSKNTRMLLRSKGKAFDRTIYPAQLFPTFSHDLLLKFSSFINKLIAADPQERFQDAVEAKWAAEKIISQIEQERAVSIKRSYAIAS